jgi:hypothetical protein
MSAVSDRTTRTTKKDQAETFLTALRKSGNVSAACRSARIGRQRVYERRESDPEFAAAWDVALDEAVDSLESEGWRRARDGTLKPIFYEGQKCGEIREYSDTLLIFLLKGHRPARFRETVRQEQQHSGEVLIRVKYDDALPGDYDPPATTAPGAEAGDQ